MANNLTVLFLNFIIVAGSIIFSRFQEKVHILAFLYAVALSLIQFTQSVPIFIVLLSFVGNFLISYALFKILRHFESGFIYILIAIVGCIILWYIAFLPIGYSQFQTWKDLGIVGK